MSITETMLRQIAVANGTPVPAKKRRPNRVINGRKDCPICGKTLNVVHHFRIARRQPNGKPIYRNKCMACETNQRKEIRQ